MSKIIFPLIASLAFATSAHGACSGPGAESLFSDDQIASFAAEGAEQPYSDGIYWHAQKNDKSIYVAGTLHVNDPRLPDVLAAFKPQLAQTDILLLELTPEDETQVEHALTTDVSMVLLPDNKTLSEILPADQWGDLSNSLMNVGVSPADVAPFQPWVISLNFILPPCAIDSILAGEPGMEQLILDILPSGVPVAALEDWRDSLAFFNGGSFEQQADDLILNIASYPLLDALTVATLDAYFDGNPQIVLPMMYAMADLLDEYLHETHAEFTDRLAVDLLNNRNLAWMSRIEDASTDHDTVFVAAGALHLGGENGVVNLLAKDGWAISKVTN